MLLEGIGYACLTEVVSLYICMYVCNIQLAHYHTPYFKYCKLCNGAKALASLLELIKSHWRALQKQIFGFWSRNSN